MSDPNPNEGTGFTPPQAVKVQGMRIVQNKSHLLTKDTKSSGGKEDGKDEKEEVSGDSGENANEELNEALKVQNSPPKQTVSGAPIRGNLDFPTEAIKDFHEKPGCQPSKDFKAANHFNQQHSKNIHQPRKQ